MAIFSENTRKFFEKAIKDTFGSYVRAFFMSVLIFIIGGISGAFVVAGSLDPRVSAIEKDTKDLRVDFLEAYKQFNEEITDLKDGDLEKKVQIQMLILYQIPSDEREKLRKEAEAQIKSKELDSIIQESN